MNQALSFKDLTKPIASLGSTSQFPEAGEAATATFLSRAAVLSDPVLSTE